MSDKALQHMSNVTESVRSLSQSAQELAEQFDYDYYRLDYLHPCTRAHGYH